MTGTATSASASGAGYFPAVSRWSVVVRPIKDPKREIHDSIGTSDLDTLDANQFAKELGRALRRQRS